MIKKTVYPGLLFAYTCFFLFLNPFDLSALDLKSLSSFQYNVWTNENGLPVSSVLAMTQTADGYLWLGTQAGLARFDGSNFNVFSRENTPVFPNNLIISLLADHKGTLWIVSHMGGIIRYKDRQFSVFNDRANKLSKSIWCMIAASDESIWIGSDTGVWCLIGEELTRVPLPPDLSTSAVNAILEDRNGRIWAGTNGDGLVLIKKREHDFESQHFCLKGCVVTTLFEDRRGALWIGTQDNGILRCWREQHFAFTTSAGLTNNNIGCIYEDRYGNIWIGTNGGGINILPADFANSPGIPGKVQASKESVIIVFPQPEEFTSLYIQCFHEDHEGTLWVGTNGGGLYSLRESKITTYTTKNGLSSNNVYAVFQDSSGRIWVGTKGYGINYCESEGQRFYTISTKDGLSADSIISFAQDLSGSIWLGTLGGGINRITNGKIDVFDHRHGLNNNIFRAIYCDPEGTIWAGAVNGEIYRFSGGKFILAANVSSRVNVLYKDSRGNFWAGTFGNGLCRINLKKRTVDFFDEKKGLSNNLVTCIHEDYSGTLWIGTSYGINCFKDEHFSPVSQQDGLPDDVVYWILEDHSYDLWVSSNRGIYSLNRKELTAFFDGTINRVNPIVYGKEAGLRSLECNGGNQPAGWKTQEGKLWFPTTFGVSVIDPMNIGVNKIPPPVVIEKIVVDGQEFPADPSVDVPTGKSNLEIHYTALSFIAPEKIRFSYIMEGYEEKWHEAAANRFTDYPHLPPGEYRFQVIACNSDGVWNKAGASIKIILKPRFYQKPAFFLIFLAAVILSVFLVYCHKKKCYLRAKSRQKTRTSIFPPEEINQYVQKLFHLLKVDKVYTDANLTIKSLASRLVISPRNLSNIINDHLKTNFYEFINDYRIKEAQRLLADPKTRDKNILDIAYEVGYNSKSAFNRAFKHFTRMTPSQFKKSNHRY